MGTVVAAALEGAEHRAERMKAPVLGVHAAWFGIADQALLSLTSFAISLQLVRTASKEVFGLFGVGYAGALLLASVANALIMTQMTVNTPMRPQLEQPRYAASMLVALFAWLLPLLLTVLIGAAVLNTLEILPSGALTLITAATGCALGTILLEFYRRYNYMRARPRSALLADVGYASVLAALLVVSALTVSPAGIHAAALLAMGLAGVLIAILVQSRVQLPTAEGWSCWRSSLAEAWQGGRWAIAGGLITWLQTYSYVYVLQTLEGATGVAEANAARLVMTPPLIINVGLTLVALPQLARLSAAGNVAAAERLATRVFGGLFLAVLLYGVLLALVWRPLIAPLLGTAYANLLNLALLWSAILCAMAVRGAYSTLLQASRHFRVITLASAVSAALVLVASILLVRSLGVTGSLLALLAGEGLLIALLAREYAKLRARHAR